MKKNGTRMFKYLVKNSDNSEEDTFISTKEHYINATELAAFLDIYYVGCRMINARLAKKIAAKILFGYPQYFYKTGNGYNMRVYPSEHAICIANYILDNLKVADIKDNIINFTIGDSRCSTFTDTNLGRLIISSMSHQAKKGE